MSTINFEREHRLNELLEEHRVMYSGVSGKKDDGLRFILGKIVDLELQIKGIIQALKHGG